MLYQEPLFRPPAEGNSNIVQVTYGCPYNRCRFCPMYKTKTYYEKTESELKAHLTELTRLTDTRVARVFLADGDTMFMQTEKLVNYMKIVKQYLPHTRRIGTYGSVFSLKNKNAEELKQLYENGLRFVYFGIESGDEETLRQMDKRCSRAEMIATCRKVLAAGLTLSVTLILGLGGKQRWQEHIKESSSLVNQISPTYTNLLSLILKHSSLENDPEYNSFTSAQYMEEMKRFIELIECQTVFFSNHASNFLPLKARLPREKSKILEIIEQCKDNDSILDLINQPL